jgi:hypothetical protein
VDVGNVEGVLEIYPASIFGICFRDQQTQEEECYSEDTNIEGREEEVLRKVLCTFNI